MKDPYDCPVCRAQIANGFHEPVPNMAGRIFKDRDTGEIIHEPTNGREANNQGATK